MTRMAEGFPIILAAEVLPLEMPQPGTARPGCPYFLLRFSMGSKSRMATPV